MWRDIEAVVLLPNNHHRKPSLSNNGGAFTLCKIVVGAHEWGVAWSDKVSLCSIERMHPAAVSSGSDGSVDWRTQALC